MYKFGSNKRGEKKLYLTKNDQMTKQEKQKGKYEGGKGVECVINDILLPGVEDPLLFLALMDLGRLFP